MLGPSDISSILDNYDLKKVKIGTVASHSALDVFDGAVEEGFRTVAVCQKGREATYARYFRALRDKNGKALRGSVDEIMLLEKFAHILEPKNLERLRKDNVLFVPNRALTSYLPVSDVEEKLRIPLLGSRNLLASVERGEGKVYYWILE